MTDTISYVGGFIVGVTMLAFLGITFFVLAKSFFVALKQVRQENKIKDEVWNDFNRTASK